VAEHALDEQSPTCREVVDTITAYLENRMASDERARFERHLAICDGCVTYLEQMRLTIRALGAVGGETIPASQRDDLVAAFRELFTS
jgi:anti-sigma factor RsiW